MEQLHYHLQKQQQGQEGIQKWLALLQEKALILGEHPQVRESQPQPRGEWKLQ